MPLLVCSNSEIVREDSDLHLLSLQGCQAAFGKVIRLCFFPLCGLDNGHLLHVTTSPDSVSLRSQSLVIAIPNAMPKNQSQLTLLNASTTSVTLPPSPHLPLSHLNPSPPAIKYSSAGRSFTLACWAILPLSLSTNERSWSSSLEVVLVNAESILGRASESVKREDSVPACIPSHYSND